MSGLTRNGTVKLVSRDHILRRERGQVKVIFVVQLTEQHWQPYPVDSYSAEKSDHTKMRRIPLEDIVTIYATKRFESLLIC